MSRRPDSKTSLKPETPSPRKARGSGLLVQIAAFLTLALLPVGLIAVIQTQRAVESSRETYMGFLRAETNSAATPEREAIVNAFGIARGLGDAIAVFDPSVADCTVLMRRAVATTPSVVFAGFTEPPGVSRCNNLGETQDITANRTVQDLLDSPRGHVAFTPSGSATGQAVVIVSEPVYGADGTYLGFVAISFPPQGLGEEAGSREGVQLVTFNARGEVLTANVPDEAIPRLLPENRDLASLAESAPSSFGAFSAAGAARDYTVVPIVPGRAYALGSWTTDEALLTDRPFVMTGIAFPIIMWIISMAVALMAIQRLVIGPVRELGSRMRAFSSSRTLEADGAFAAAPAELRGIDETFESMARKIIRDEADLENTLYEREVLLKEVHHRAKNNLQLMSSVINMQIRNSGSDEAREVLRSVQGRLRSLATVHRALYEAPELSQVEFNVLLRDLIGELTTIGADRPTDAEPEVRLERVTLVPDQAAPLAILAVEAITNAFKYMSEDAEGRRRIGIFLDRTQTEVGEEVLLAIENTVGSTATDGGDGLGRQLITALSLQLPGEASETIESGLHRIEIRFLKRDLETEG